MFSTSAPRGKTWPSGVPNDTRVCIGPPLPPFGFFTRSFYCDEKKVGLILACRAAVRADAAGDEEEREGEEENAERVLGLMFGQRDRDGDLNI